MGVRDGLSGLHYCYAKGLGTAKSETDAYYWAKQADQVAKPAGVGRYLLARCYALGLGVAKNPVTADTLYDKAAGDRFPIALLHRGETLASKLTPAGGLTPEERAAADDDLRAAWAAGLPSAAVALSRLAFYDPKATPARIQEAVTRLEKAASKDVPEAVHALWVVYAFDRKNFPGKDLPKAKGYLQKAADLGYAFSQRILAAEYYQERPWAFTTAFPKDAAKAFKWASLGADQGDGGAHFLLSQIYRNGHGKAVNHEKLRTHLDEAVRLEYPAAMNALFWDLCEGKIYTQNFEKASKVARQSADLGHPDRHYNLGFVYHELLDAKTGKFRVLDPLILEYNANSHHTLHHYLQAYRKTNGKHEKAKEFLEAYRNWYKSEAKDGGTQFFRIAPRGAWAPSGVFKQLEKDYPTSAKELTTAFGLDKR